MELHVLGDGADRSAMSARASVVPAALSDLLHSTAVLRLEDESCVADMEASLNDDSMVEYAHRPAVRVPEEGAAGERGHQARRGSSPRAKEAEHWARKAIGYYECKPADVPRAVKVCVIDSGIDESHPDFDGVPIEHRVFIEPLHDRRDLVGHGTHVAGIIAAKYNSSTNTTGICQGELVVFKVLPSASQVWDTVAYYRALAHAGGVGASVVNLSIGGAHDRTEEALVKQLIGGGKCVVAAMGNDYEEGNPVRWPAAIDGVIAVGAANDRDERAAFSCTGKHICLLAPGVDIPSTIPVKGCESCPNIHHDEFEGTSMAAPFVSAVAALVAAKWPTMTPAQIRGHLMATARRMARQRGSWDEEHGAGMVNMVAALRKVS